LRLSSGLYEQLIDELMRRELNDLDPTRWSWSQEAIDAAESPLILSRYLERIVRRALDACTGDQALQQRVSVCNDIIERISARVPEAELGGNTIPPQVEILLALLDRPASLDMSIDRLGELRPKTGLSQSALLTGSPREPSLASELRKEILSSDRIDILMSFIKWSGLRLIEKELREFTLRPNATLRIITTSYMGATDLRAVSLLASLPHTQVRVSYDTDRTRLHAKAYLFHRDSGFTTAYIGSSNISSAAITSGLEWNIKVTARDVADIVGKFEGTFETYWSDPEFQSYSLEDEPALRVALSNEKVADQHQYLVDMHLYGFQQDILERLKAERELHARRRNLVVAATGTGKTVVAAFDYKRYCEEHPGKKNRLLFVAHREEILRQSLACFRNVLHDANFGDVLVGDSEPSQTDYLFVSIQMLAARGVGTFLRDPTTYDYVVVDEFHHAEAPTYVDFLEYVQPDILLGLTATPERMDGKDIFKWFGGRIAAEIRLPEAIDRGLLCSFQYFGVTDVVDLNTFRWSRGGYDVQQLNQAYSANDSRARLIVDAVQHYCRKAEDVRGLGFCVSIEHAEFMADFFRRAGIPAVAVSSNTAPCDRVAAQRALRKKEVNFIFAVDLYNEGIDIPEIDTVLFLRPTESLTVFLQQLGRGLRIDEGKDCLTVLDFIGKAQQSYSFEARFQALLGHTARSIQKEVADDFPFLPKGCNIQLERVAKESVLENIRSAVRSGRSRMVQRIAEFEDETQQTLTMSAFLEYYQLEAYDIYETGRSWSRLCSEAGKRGAWAEPDEDRLTKGLFRLAHADSPSFLHFIVDTLEDNMELSQSESPFAVMLWCDVWQTKHDRAACSSWQQVAEVFVRNSTMRSEYVELAKWCLDHVSISSRPVLLPFESALELHRSYLRDEILAGLGYYSWERQLSQREGVLRLKDKDCDVFLVTLNKSEKDYSESTMYQDYAISDRLFHWQSQSTVSEASPTGQRYIHQVERSNTVLLFVRENKQSHGKGAPYYYLGPATFVESTGSRPMNIVWELKYPMPARLCMATKTLVVSE
jgi:superfamily II DNA or RNA helicase/HKD family nuclease